MAQLPPNTHFDVVSNGTDLDYVISLLIDQQRSAERVGIKKDSLPALAEIKAHNVEYYLREYCLHLVNHSKPAKKKHC